MLRSSACLRLGRLAGKGFRSTSTASNGTPLCSKCSSAHKTWHPTHTASDNSVAAAKEPQKLRAATRLNWSSLPFAGKFSTWSRPTDAVTVLLRCRITAWPSVRFIWTCTSGSSCPASIAALRWLFLDPTRAPIASILNPRVYAM
eukprot:2879612-Rhodomonas_salina.2